MGDVGRSGAVPIRSVWAARPMEAASTAGRSEPVSIVGAARRADARVDAMDLAFFGVSAEAAAQLGPRARAVLELAWEAVEDAGITDREGAIGWFVADEPDVARALADHLGASGPRMTIGSGMLAVHLACQALRDGDADLALAIGPGRDGATEVLVLRRTADAARGHLRSLTAVIASGACAGEDLGELQRRVRRRAGVGPADLVREMRATGMHDVLSAPADQLVALVSQDDHASVVLLLEDPATAAAWAHAERERAITASFEPVSARPPSTTPIPGPVRRTPVPRNRGEASEGPSYSPPPEHEGTPAGRQSVGASSELESAAHVLVVSARSEEALRDRSRALARVLRSGADVGAVAATLAHRRVHFEHRLAVSARAREQAVDALERAEGCHRVSDVAAPVAFLFTGEGTHRPQMAAELYDVEPVFRDTLNRCDALLRHHMERPLLTVLFPRSDRDELQNLAFAHPAIFSVQFAITELWRYWGVVPDAVLGYGLGEYVAATVAGVLRLEDAIALVAARARLLVEHLAADGAMALAYAPERLVRPALRPREGRVAIAAVNSANELVLSGYRADLEAMLGELEEVGVRTRLLGARYGLNSPHVEPALEQFEHVARLPTSALPRITYVSGRTGEITATEVTSAGYWRAQLRDPVRFALGAQTLLDAGFRHFVEVGPKPVLARLVGELAPGARVVPTMHPDSDDHATMLDGLGALWLSGCRVHWATRYGRREPVALPPYPWQRGGQGAELDASAAPVEAIVPAEGAEEVEASGGGAATEEVGVAPVETVSAGPFQRYVEDDSFAIDLPPVADHRPVLAIAAEDVPEPAFLSQPEEADVAPAASPVESDAAPEPLALRVAWRELPSPQEPTGEPATWLVLVDAEGVGDYVTARLGELGHDHVRVRPEPAYARGDGTVFVADPADPDAWDPLVERLRAVEGPLRILHLWTLDVVDDAQPDAFDKVQVLGSGSLLHLRSALERAGRTAQAWIVTRGAAPVDEEVGTVSSATLWGTARAIWPDSGWIDLDPLDEDPDAVLANVLAGDGENRVVLRQGGRRGARLVPAELGPVSLDPEGTWLVFAPIALALPIACYILERGGRRLVLAPPVRPDAASVQSVMALQPEGGRVGLVPAHPGKPGEVERLFRRLEHEPPLAGVVLAPGAPEGGGWSELREAVLPWVRLGWDVHVRTLAASPARFVALVPPDALLGGAPGAATVGAGLAGLVRHRLASGRPGVLGFSAPDAPLDPAFAVERGELAVLDRSAVSRSLGRLLDELVVDAS